MIIIKTPEQIEAMRKGGRLLAGIMEELGKLVLPGKSTLHIDELAERLVFSSGGTPAFKNYGEEGNLYPATVCASLNDEIVHGLPSADRILEEGDLLKIDIGMKYQGMITDMARTFPVGKISPEAQKIMDTTRESLDAGILKLRSGADLLDYSRAVETYAKAGGVSVVRDLVGHGVGMELHEDPIILNYVPRRNYEERVILKEGMTLALEPMLNAGSFYTKLDRNGWTWKTKDGKLSAHFEDTVVITREGCEILTRR